MTPGAWRFAGRLARREVRRRPLRTVLVALLVAAPVTGMTAAAVLLRTNEMSPAADWAQSRGRADAVIGGNLGEYALPPGTVTHAFRRDYLTVRAATGARTHAEITDLAPSDPIARGIYRGVEGRSPERAGEVLLSRGAAGSLKVRVGDTLDLERPIAATLTVVGVADATVQHGAHFVVLARDESFPTVLVPKDGGGPRPVMERVAVPVQHLVDLPDTLPLAERAAWARAARSAFEAARSAKQSGSLWLAPGLEAASYAPVAGAPLQDLGYVPPQRDGVEQVAWSWVVGAGVLAVVGIVIASAFAAGSRRQLTTLGQLSANGAGQGVLRRVLLLQGTWTGAVGALLGLAGGAALLAALAPYRYALLGRDTGPYRVRPLELVPIVVLAVVTATVAALVPARTISRTPVLNALAGRRPLGAVPRWLAPAGLVTCAGGLALLSLAVVGSAGTAGAGSGAQVWAVTGGAGAVAILLGSSALTPRYVSVLDGLGTRLRGSWRFAARSLARQRTRTAAVVSAVCVTTALAVSAAALVASATAQNDADYASTAPNVVHVRAMTTVGNASDRTSYVTAEPPAEVVAGVLRELPGAKVVRVPRVASDPEREFDGIPVTTDEPSANGVPGIPGAAAAIATPDTVRLYHLDAKAKRELDTVGAVAFAYEAGHATLRAKPGTAPFTVRVLAERDYPVGYLPSLLLTPERAGALGWKPAVPLVTIEAPEALTADQRAGVSDAYSRWLDDHSGTEGVPMVESVDVVLDWPPGGPDPLAVQALLAAGALLFTIFFVAVSLALASAETRDERDALSVVGAGTRVLRRTSGRKALIVTALGAALGVPVGLLPVVVFTRVDATGLPFAMPWTVLGLLVVVVPLVAGAVTTAASGIALRLRPVRVSTMTFD